MASIDLPNGVYDELIGRYDTGDGDGRASQKSPCVTIGDERQSTRSGRGVRPVQARFRMPPSSSFTLPFTA